MNRSKIVRTLSRGIRLFVVAALLGALTNMAVPPPVAHALALEVDTSADNPALTACTAALSDCSLRGAITRANTNPDHDTITFAAVTNGAPIVLDGAASEDANASGDLDILDGGDLTIQGNGAANTIIDGGGIDRVFHVCPGGGCANTVTFNEITIRNGNVFGVGGGIFNNGATLNVQNSTIGGAGPGNMAVGGGGIYNQAGTTTVDGSTVSGNTASTGGGVYNRATLYIQNGSTIGGAGAGNQASTWGGGIYNYDGTTTVDGSTISANTASRGGGIYNWATLNIQNGSTIGGGAGNGATEIGGGIYNYDGTTQRQHGRRRRRGLQSGHAEHPEWQHHRRGRGGQPGHQRRRRHLQRRRQHDSGWQHRQRQHG
jgi:hypothetical protein